MSALFRPSVRCLHRSAALNARGPLTFDGWYPRDHKPGPYPTNEEERRSAAIKYGLRPEDYIPMNKDDVVRYAGDYPDLGMITYDHKDPYENWTDRHHRRNWGEMVGIDTMRYRGDRMTFTGLEAEDFKPWNSLLLILRVVVPMMLMAYYVTRDDPNCFRWKNPVMPKQYSHDYYRAWPPPPGSGFPVSPALFSPSRAPPEANCPTASREPIAIHIRHFAPFYRAHWYRFSLEFRIRLCVIAAEKVSPHLPGKPPAPTVRAGPLLASGRALLRAASALRPTGDSVFVFTRRFSPTTTSATILLNSLNFSSLPVSVLLDFHRRMTPDNGMSGTGESAMSAMLLAAAAAASSMSEPSRTLEGAGPSRKRKATPSSSSSTSPDVPEVDTSPSATPTAAKILKMRKLKSYSVDEKLDIIDYAKIIGNRAAGREFNVAESSIREWRKNEDKIRQMAEVSPNKFKNDSKANRLEELDRKLISYIENTHDVTWHDIGLKANDLWRETVGKEDLEESDKEFNANMGWVSRFFKRTQSRVRPIAPPQSNPASVHLLNDPVSMVQAAPLEMPTGAVAESILNQSVSKRRKPLRPQRVDRPTLRLSPQQISDCDSIEAPSHPKTTSHEELNSTTQGENLNIAG
ncbi:hypothetical protein QR680_005582 [Steinernema hermaphroditum]|uniref:HTH CENPB-type domain-containing protein n=1 Tax=Steinernema hermaphroditum TaxID=289476 RepID=A0AA39LVN3_9BILA|nr:hypothetical protein QR680_005582 [Steinernema hermaphroditum]